MLVNLYDVFINNCRVGAVIGHKSFASATAEARRIYGANAIIRVVY